MANLNYIILKDCIQDGGTFYVAFKGEGTEEDAGHSDGLDATYPDGVIASYPTMVKNDYDIEGARQARERFAKEYPGFIAAAISFAGSH